MVDLGPVGLPYTVNLTQMTQIRNVTGFVRHIRREKMAVPYIADHGINMSHRAAVPKAGSTLRASLSRAFSFPSATPTGPLSHSM